VAVLVASVSLLGHRAHTEEVILQNQVSDQWAFYQAKSIRRHADEVFADLASLMTAKDAEKAAKLAEKRTSEAEQYRDQGKELEAKAHELEAEQKHATKQADRFDLGEAILEIALVITSITLLSGRRLFWYLGILFAIAGVALGITGLLI
jgi:hypothetical protein